MIKIWTEEKIELLKDYLKAGMDIQRIAKKMDTTYDAVGKAIGRYGLAQYKTILPSAQKVLENTDFDILADENFQEAKLAAKLSWKLPKSSKIKSKSKDIQVALFIPDVHIPHENKPACKSVLKLMDDVTFDKLVIIGDFLDFGCISHWNKNRHKTLELKRLKNDYIIGNSLLDEFDKRVAKNCDKYYLKGNHEVWSDDLLEDMPQLEGMIEPESQLFLNERGYKISPYNDLVPFGKLFVTHGIYASANSIKKHLDELKVNILFGHTHQLGMLLSSSPAREIAFAGYNIGCLCDLSPDYMRNRPHSWTHGFAVGYFYPNGYFDIQLIRIVEGKFIFNNKVYDGNI